jgi:GTP-binding protein
MGEFQKSFECAIRKELFLWDDLPILFLSAKEKNVKQLPLTALELTKKAQKKISTSVLNRFFATCLEDKKPSHQGALNKQFKIFYALQISTNPHTIRVYCNQEKLLQRDYLAYLRHRFVDNFQLAGCSLKFQFVSKEIRGSGFDTRQMNALQQSNV